MVISRTLQTAAVHFLKQVNFIISENIVNVIIQLDGEEPLYFAEMLLMKAYATITCFVS